jgi:uncharacterized membrane protein YfcA
MVTSMLILMVSVFAGCLGAVLGIGGGMIVIPALTLGLGVSIHHAIGASLISVIATSSGAAALYIRDRLTNLRLAILLEIATTFGALAGVALSTVLYSRFLYLLFAVILLQSSFSMWRGKKQEKEIQRTSLERWSDQLNLDSEFFDPAVGETVQYGVTRIPLGFFLMVVAGVISGLLGIGSGALKVLAMDRAMRVPMKVSSATSNFMMGVTAAASASAYYLKGDILPEIAAPVALGVLSGAVLGSRLLMVLPSSQIRRVFVVLLLIMAIQMGMKGLG